MTFCFGESQHERIEVNVIRYERDVTGDYNDDNWLTVEIRVSAGTFHGTVAASIVTSELVDFTAQLRPLYQSLRGVAEFATLEAQLHLHLKGDGKGHIALAGEVRDQPGVGNWLHFALMLDQSQLGRSLRELEEVISNFPVRSL